MLFCLLLILIQQVTAIVDGSINFHAVRFTIIRNIFTRGGKARPQGIEAVGLTSAIDISDLIARMANSGRLLVTSLIKPADKHLTARNGNGRRHVKRVALCEAIVVLIFQVVTIPRGNQVGGLAVGPCCARDRQVITSRALLRVVVEHDFGIRASNGRNGVLGVLVDFISLDDLGTLGNPLSLFQVGQGLGIKQLSGFLVNVFHGDSLILRNVLGVVLNIARGSCREAHRLARNARVVVPAIQLVRDAVIFFCLLKCLRGHGHRHAISIKGINMRIDIGVARVARIPHVEVGSDGRFSDNLNRAVEVIATRLGNLIRMQDDVLHVILICDTRFFLIGLKQRIPISATAREYQSVGRRRTQAFRPRHHTVRNVIV